MPYAIDLFCGAGGCSEGLLQAGFHILFSSDISEMVEVTVYKKDDLISEVKDFLKYLKCPYMKSR